MNRRDCVKLGPHSCLVMYVFAKLPQLPTERNDDASSCIHIYIYIYLRGVLVIADTEWERWKCRTERDRDRVTRAPLFSNSFHLPRPLFLARFSSPRVISSALLSNLGCYRGNTQVREHQRLRRRPSEKRERLLPDPRPLGYFSLPFFEEISSPILLPPSPSSSDQMFEKINKTLPADFSFPLRRSSLFRPVAFSLGSNATLCLRHIIERREPLQ